MADRVASQPFPRCSAARHCEIRPPVCENLLSSDFLNGRYAHEFLHVLPSRLTTLLSQPYTKSPIRKFPYRTSFTRGTTYSSSDIADLEHVNDCHRGYLLLSASITSRRASKVVRSIRTKHTLSESASLSTVPCQCEV